MNNRAQLGPGTNELAQEVVEIRLDLARLQSEARKAGDWKKEVAILDRRMKLIEMRLREVREHSTNILAVNFDVDTKTAERMALSFLARQKELRENGEQS